MRARMAGSQASVEAFIAAVPDDARRADARELAGLLAEWTGEPPAMSGTSIVGFGSYRYRYASGREGEAGAAGFSPRKAATTVYLPDGFAAYADLLADLGPHTTSVSCLYLKNLDDVDLSVLETILRRSWETVTAPGFGQV